MGLIDICALILRIYLKFLGVGVLIEWNLVCLNSLNIEVLILMDWVSVLFVVFVVIISLIILIYRGTYIDSDKFKDRFMGLVLLFIISIILIIISPNVIRIILGWDGLGIISYLLVIYYQNYNSYNSGMITILTNRLGDMGLLISIGLIILYGRWNILMIEGSGDLDYLIMCMIILASLTKSAQLPFSVWLPEAIAAPTPVSALVHSSTLVTAGVYLIIRFHGYLIVSRLNIKVIYLSMMTIIISGVMALLEWDLKKIIAFSTLNQLGLIIIILIIGYSILTFFHLLIHAVFKSVLFIGVGIIIHFISIKQDIRLIGGLNKFMPVVMIRFYISLMSICGFPFIAGFYSKDLIIEFIYLSNINVIFYYLIMICLMFTVSYSLRLFIYLFFINYKFFRFIYYEDYVGINISIVILIILRVSGGSGLMWIFFFDLKFPYLKVLYKLLTFLIILLGLFLIFIYFIIKKLINLRILFYFMSIIGLMGVNLVLNKLVNFLGVNLYKTEKTWMELIVLDFKNIIIFKVHSYKYKIFMFIYLVYLFIYIIFILHYLNSLLESLIVKILRKY